MHYLVYYTDLSNREYSSMEPIGIFDDKEKARKVAKIEQSKIDDSYKNMSVDNREKYSLIHLMKSTANGLKIYLIISKKENYI